MNEENKNTNTTVEEKEIKKELGPCVTEDTGNALARLRADAMLAVATDAAACMQHERLRLGSAKAGAKEAQATADRRGACLIRAMAILAVSSNPMQVSLIARRYWVHARDELRACKKISERD